MQQCEGVAVPLHCEILSLEKFWPNAEGQKADNASICLPKKQNKNFSCLKFFLTAQARIKNDYFVRWVSADKREEQIWYGEG